MPQLRVVSPSSEQLDDRASTLAGALKAHFETGSTKSRSWRLSQLDALEHFLREREQDILDALHADLRKPAMEAFGAMSEFAEQLREIMRQLPFAGMMDTPFNDMNEIGGFPVRVRTYRKGQLDNETTLKSVESQDLADDVFAVPESYKVKNIADQAKKKKR